MLDLIYEFDSYREFLNAYCEAKKSEFKGFSLRWLAKKAGVSSPSLVHMIMTGKRRPSLDTVERLCAAMNLDEDASTYAVLIAEVDLDRAAAIVALAKAAAHDIRRKALGGSEETPHTFSEQTDSGVPVGAADLSRDLC